MAIKICLVNVKGGVGKTSSAVNISACLGDMGKDVLIVDVDPQSNTTQYLNMYDPEALSTYDALMDKNLDVTEVIVNTSIKNVDILPGNLKLAVCENEIISDTKRSRENRLQRVLSKVEDKYDYIVIDCPPSLNIITTNSLVASDFVLVPIKIDKFALDGFSYLLSFIDEIKDEFNTSLELMGAFITMDKRTSVNKAIKEALRDSLGDRFFKTSIRENAKLVQSTFEQIPVVLFDKTASSSEDYMNLTKEVLSRV